MLFISPPFGTYLNLPNARSVKGSFTLEKRPGKWMQIIKTLRYSFKYNGWINKIGLRNPGIDYAIQKYANTDNIVSVAILKEEDIQPLLKKIPDTMNLEINISCPNTDKHLISKDIHKFLNIKRRWCIIKLSPLTDMTSIDNYYNQGFRQFHCSNTLPTKMLKEKTFDGGISGPILIPYTLKLVKKIKDKYPDTEIIAGGGIRDLQTLQKYKNAGADHFSVSTLLFSPIKFSLIYFSFWSSF